MINCQFPTVIRSFFMYHYVDWVIITIMIMIMIMIVIIIIIIIIID